MKIQVVFYIKYGHVYEIAEAVAEGAHQVHGAQVSLWQVPELVPDDVLQKSGADIARAVFAHVPVATPRQLAAADAIIFGTPTQFGNIAAQIRNFLDQTGGLWAEGALVAKVGSVFTSTASQAGNHARQPSCDARASRHDRRRLPVYRPRLANMTEISGGTPYGASIFDRRRRRATAERERARDRPLSGQTCRRNHNGADRRSQNSGRG